VLLDQHEEADKPPHYTLHTGGLGLDATQSW
jgi:hypothetical protein